MKIDFAKIIEKIEKVRNKKDPRPSKRKMGEILGSNAKHNAQKIAKYEKFLNSEIVKNWFKNLEKVAEYLEIDASEFFKK